MRCFVPLPDDLDRAHAAIIQQRLIPYRPGLIAANNRQTKNHQRQPANNRGANDDR